MRPHERARGRDSDCRGALAGSFCEGVTLSVPCLVYPGWLDGSGPDLWVCAGLLYHVPSQYDSLLERVLAWGPPSPGDHGWSGTAHTSLTSRQALNLFTSSEDNSGVTHTARSVGRSVPQRPHYLNKPYQPLYVTAGAAEKTVGRLLCALRGTRVVVSQDSH